MQTNAMITIYNHYIDQKTQEDHYQRTMIGPVFWDSASLIDEEEVTVYVPFASSSERQYVGPKAFAALEDKSAYWTLDMEDKIVRGVIDFEPDANQRIGKLEQMYDNVITIKRVDTRDYGSKAMQHWEVGGV